jgi:hypothetical protein
MQAALIGLATFTIIYIVAVIKKRREGGDKKE